MKLFLPNFNTLGLFAKEHPYGAKVSNPSMPIWPSARLLDRFRYAAQTALKVKMLLFYNNYCGIDPESTQPTFPSLRRYTILMLSLEMLWNIKADASSKSKCMTA